MKSAIVYEDKEIIVIHKPPGIATETARIGQTDVVSELKNYRVGKKEDSYIGVVHRLDQPVEGLLVFAKNQRAAKQLTMELQAGKLKKYYLTLVPRVHGQAGDLEDYLLKDGRTNLSSVVSKGTKDAKVAKLHWTLLQKEELEGHSYDLVEVEIFTGRHHQIRVQMSHAGMPLLGDHKYGNEESSALADLLGIRQTALLAYKLSFEHPTTKKNLNFLISTPKNWHCS